MICADASEVAEALTHAVSVVGGALTAVADGWQWQPGTDNDDRVVQFRLGRKVHRLLLDPLESPAADPGDIEAVNATLQRWLQWNGGLPAGIGITVQNDTRPLFCAAVPNAGYSSEELSDALQAHLRGFASLPPSLAEPPPAEGGKTGEADQVSAESIAAWADDAGATIERLDPDDEQTTSNYSLKLPAIEPASLKVECGVRLSIDAAIDGGSGDATVSPAGQAAGALLALSIGNRLPLVRAAITSSDATTIEYQASAYITGDSLPPPAWLQRATAELTAAVRASRNELEALHASSSLATVYLSARGLALESAAPS